MKHKLILLLFIFPGMLLAANWPAEVDKMVASAKKSVHLIDIHQFKKVVDKPDDALIIDVREPNEYYDGHIPGAINIPRGLLEFKIWKQLGYPDKVNKQKTLYLYCKLSGRSALAAQSLTKLGFSNAIAVDMKTADWRAAGYLFEY